MPYILIAIGVSNIALSFLLLYARRNDLSARLFFVFSVISGYWVINNFLTGIFPSLTLLRNGYATAVFMVSSVAVWAFYLSTNQFNKYLSIALYSLGLFFSLLAQFTNYILEDARNITFGGGDAIYGPLFFVYGIYIIIILIVSFTILFKALMNARGIKKIQLKYVLFGMVIYAIISSSVSVIFPFFGINKFIPLDSASSLFFIAFTTYAMVRYRFMDIRVIIFRTITFGFIVLIITSVFSVISTRIIKLFTDLAELQSNIYSGLIIAILVSLFYQPMRRVVERATNAFLYKKSYDPDVLMGKITETASSILNFEKLLDKICAILTDAFHCEKIGIALLNDKKNKLKIAYQNGFKPGVAENLVSFPNAVKIMFRQFIETPGIYVVDERKTQFDNGEFKPVNVGLLLALHENDLALIVPLYVKDKLKGVLVIGTKKSGDPYASRDINILNIISSQFAVAIDRAQLYRHLEDLVDARTKELNEANIQLKKLDASKSDFISIASHQLRAPCTAIKGWISMINDGDLGKLPEKFVRPMKVVYASNERLIHLVNDLLNISRIESGRQKYDFKKNDLVALADEVVTKLQIQAENKKLKLTFHKPKEKFPMVFCDSERMHEVMMNLVENSIKYTPSGSISVSIKAEPANVYMFKQPQNSNSKENDTRPKDMITFTVKDTGMGIAKEVMPLLFKKFARGEGSFVVHTEGTGLGLYVAKLNIETHGGKVWAESEGAGKGSTFIFTIPVAGPKVLPFEAPDAKK